MIKNVLPGVLLLFLSNSLLAQGSVSATISNFNNDKGVCRACIFNNSEAFSGDGKAVQCLVVPVSNKTARIVFSNLPKGSYAISLFHDANNNGELDTNFLGIPTEGYGASKNNLPFAGAPTFKGNRFEVTGNSSTSLQIRLRYL